MTFLPRATYRLQLQPDFTFYQAAALAPYLAALGVSHLYASPYLQAAPGSRHGYDVVNYTKVNEELGGNDGHKLLCKSLKNSNLGQVLDVVPNHMAIHPRNCWWWDVLENGQASRYASFFDVDWEVPENRYGNKILLPILENHYGRVLEKGKIQLVREDEIFFIRYYEQAFPVSPHSLVSVFKQTAREAGSAELAFLADTLASLPPPAPQEQAANEEYYRNMLVIRKLLKRLLSEEPELASALDLEIYKLNRHFGSLDELLNRQHYRLAYWTASRQDLAYRRFFDVNSLVALHAEDERVFTETHRLIAAWIKQDILDGIRVDHPDGLRDPFGYLERLRNLAPDLWIVVEKILGPEEELPSSWPVAGTSGYDFLNLTGELFLDPDGEKPFTELYQAYTGIRNDYDTLLRHKKLKVITELLGSDVNRLTEIMLKICERYPRHRDYTRDIIQETLKEICSCFPVYRTYIRADANEVGKEDERIITGVVSAVRHHRPDIDPDLLLFLQDLLLLRYPGQMENEFVMRLQQLTGPAMAKGAEDTAFYAYNRFIALNEVGGNPGRWGVTVADFHEWIQQRAANYPMTMLSTSTHDTKRSEDVRARLYLLSEIPERWQQAVGTWTRQNEVYKTSGQAGNQGETAGTQPDSHLFKDLATPRTIPDYNTEYFLYQTLVGAWPLEKERLLDYMQKSVREAKTYTAWRSPHAVYENGLKLFIEKLYEDKSFLVSLETFAEQLKVPGWINSLSLTLLKLTCPGVPDIYQGTELWFMYLVDPDNRRPVDFNLRQRLLAELEAAPPEAVTPEKILERMEEGLPKLWVIRQTLALRGLRPELFTAGQYQPLNAGGGKATHLVAYQRSLPVTEAVGPASTPQSMITVIPRLILGLGDKGRWAADWPKQAADGAGVWGETSLLLPPGEWEHIFTGEKFVGTKLEMRELFKRFPVALLVQRTP